ncbi:hypothetical protein Pla123a_03850 [Posidoniimonas polymericola]|uniref:ParB/Sulfiredoxin domain-containing protein n=1 Tax=Posidoniimonas polymericola TaxID=2528002 RepID=A0A5C5ZEJ5_9BACT|nr:hypothetical protein [Posidoniimonas polymericola]TWT85578.1 hypothetical protein Pla123a_03850 [Posidoniimonas polymericola]
MNVRDRVTELRRVPAGCLTPHPLNWRTHPQGQRAAMQAVLGELGYAAALVARELPDGSLQLIDGHLRAEVTPDASVPVLLVDLDDLEAAKLLATHDSIAALAGVDRESLDELLGRVETESPELQAVFDGLAAQANPTGVDVPANLPDLDIPETYQVVVDCRDEAEQFEVYQAMREEGRKCRVLTL